MSTQSIHQFAEKVALITDVTNPIGMATALQLALNGSYVIAGVPDGADFDTQPIEDLRSLGTLAMSVTWPRTSEGAEALVNAARERFERLDILVNSLKSQRESSFLSQEATAFASTIDQILTLPCVLTHHAARLMAERPKPRIVNIAYLHDASNGPADAVFEAAQSGFAALTQTLSNDLADHFRVNGIIVRDGPADTIGFDPELVRPQGSVAPGDAARTILFLLSGESKSVNGQMISLG